MSKAMLCVVPQAQSVASLAKHWSIPVTDLWLPCITSRDVVKNRSVIEIDETTAVLLLLEGGGDDLSTRMIRDRSAILNHLALANSNPRNFLVPEIVLARSTAMLFVRASGGNRGCGRQRLSEGTTVLRRPVSDEVTIEEGSRFAHSTKPVTTPSAISSHTPSVSTVAPPTKAITSHEADTLIKERIEAERTKRARSSDGGTHTSSALMSSGDALLDKFTSRLEHVRNEPPLHLVKLLSGNCKENITFRIGGSFTLSNRTWLRPDISVLSYQHLPEANRKMNGAAGRIFAPQRLIAVLPLLYGLLKPTSNSHNILDQLRSATLQDEHLPELLRSLSHRGYKLVVVEHIPDLHHGNAHVLQSISDGIVAFLDEHFPLLPIQVVLSMASQFAAQTTGISRCLLPNAGLYQVFLYHYNGQIEADRERSFMLRTAEEGRPCFGFASLSWAQQDGFASCCGRKGLRTIAATDFSKEVNTLVA